MSVNWKCGLSRYSVPVFLFRYSLKKKIYLTSSRLIMRAGAGIAINSAAVPTLL